MRTFAYRKSPAEMLHHVQFHQGFFVAKTETLFMVRNTFFILNPTYSNVHDPWWAFSLTDQGRLGLNSD